MSKKEVQTFDSATTNPDLSQVQDISPEELEGKKETVHLIDVRRPDEYNGELEHIPGATLITLDTLDQNKDSIPKEGTLVFICRSGKRSAHASAWALENGWSHVYNMQGGMIAWNKLGFETEA